jgi:hypothetical protein
MRTTYIKTVSSKEQFAIPKRLRAELGVNQEIKRSLLSQKMAALPLPASRNEPVAAAIACLYNWCI